MNLKTIINILPFVGLLVSLRDDSFAIAKDLVYLM